MSIFISHVEENRGTAEAISRGLQAAGFNAWSYEVSSVPGPTYLSQVMDAIENADAMILLISPEALGSHQVAREIEAAHELDRPIIPVLVGITHEKYLQRRPEWRLALGAFTSIAIPHDGVDAIMPKIVGGLEALGVARGQATAPVTAPGTRRKPHVGVLRQRPWLGVLLAAALVAALVTIGAVLLSSRNASKISGRGTTGTSTGTSTSPSTSTATPPAVGAGGIPEVTQPLDTLTATLRVKPLRPLSTDTLTVSYSVTNTSKRGFKASETQMTILLGGAPGGTGVRLSDISQDIAAGATVRDTIHPNLADVSARPGPQTVWIDIGQRFPGGTVGDVYPARVAIIIAR